MEYLLSQEEYDALTPVRLLQERNEALEDARKIIVRLADIPCGKTYCDDCPVSDIGFYEDDTNAISSVSSNLICGKSRDYSQ